MKLRREARWIWPILAIVIAGLACAGYVLSKQRLESPTAERYRLHLEFERADAVTPGLGAPITVAGVKVGQIDGTELKNGRGVISVSIDPEELPRVYADATAQLVPNTPLKDMQIRLHPGSRSGRPLREGSTISVADTTTPVDSDALLRALDTDTRAWVRTMIASLGVGLKGRKRDLNSVLRSLGPTAAQLRQISGLLASRRKQIPALVHNLRVITQATASRDGDLTRVVDAGDATLDALASNDESLRRSLELLPGTLRAARTTLGRTPRFARSLDRTLTALDPSLKALPTTLRECPDSVRGIVPLPTAELGKFIDGVAPLAKYVRPTSRDLAAATPSLTKAFRVLGRTSNQIAYKPKGSESYLFWLAWFAHNANSMLSTQDAHGAVVRGFAITSCASQGISPALTELFQTRARDPLPGGTRDHPPALPRHAGAGAAVHRHVRAADPVRVAQRRRCPAAQAAPVRGKRPVRERQPADQELRRTDLRRERGLGGQGQGARAAHGGHALDRRGVRPAAR